MCNFKMNIAISYGIHAAIVAQFIWDNLRLGSYDGKEYVFNGEKWCRCSILMMTGFFPFMTKPMIRDAIKILLENRVLKKGCFNQNRFDKTNWYCFTEYGRHLMEEGEDDE